MENKSVNITHELRVLRPAAILPSGHQGHVNEFSN